MKLPLHDDLFPPVLLAEDETEGLTDFAGVLVRDAIQQFDDFRAKQHGHVDEKAWRLVRKRGGLAAYSDRKPASYPTAGLSSSSAAAKPYKSQLLGMLADPTWTSMSQLPTKLHSVLVVGTLKGELNDLVYGLHHSTSREVRQVKSACVGDKVVDSKILASIIEPTAAEPLRGLHIKWALSEFAPLHGARVLRKVLRPRDFVYLESIGLTTTAEGEQIGYNILQSMQIPGVRELPDLQIVRASTSVCSVFRRKGPGVVEVFMKGYIDALGEIPASIALIWTTKALLSHEDALYYGQMKKLAWLLKHRQSVGTREGAGSLKLLSPSDSLPGLACGTCSQELSPAKWRACRMCAVTLCSACVSMKKLCFLDRARNDKVVQCPIDFCNVCIRAAMAADVLEIAAQQLQADPREPFELDASDWSYLTHSLSTDITSPSASDVLDPSSEFFG